MTVHMPLLAAAALIALTAAPAFAQTIEDRLKRGEAVIRELNRGQPQPALERMRQEFPFLAEATEAYALGDVWSRPGLDRRSRSVAVLTSLIAHGHHEELAMHLRAALRNGLTVDEIREVILQSAVYSGVPAANTAFRIASEVFAEEA